MSNIRIRLTGVIAICMLVVACDAKQGADLPSLNTNPDISRQFDSAEIRDFDITSPIRTPRIVGGTEVPDLQYPWMAAVFFDIDGVFLPGCGASLISDRFLLTAAHCMVNSATDQTLDSADIRLLMGTTDLLGDGTVLEVSRIIVHPDYTSSSQDNDIALLELPESVAFQPITISDAANPVPVAGELSTVAGWGNTSEGGDQSQFLLEVDLPVAANNSCQIVYGDAFYPTGMMCAGGRLDARQGACQGDSGGPIFVPRGDQIVQAGIVSFGFGCARPGVPGVYTRVSNYADWITRMVTGTLIYDGSNEDEVVAIANPVEMLEPNTRVSRSIPQGAIDLYRVSDINLVTLETIEGDSDLFVFNAPVFTEDTLVCQSEQFDLAIDQCSVPPNTEYYIAVFGFLESDYALTATAAEDDDVVDTGIVTLQLNTPVRDFLIAETGVVYRATAGDTVTVSTFAGNAQLAVFSNDTPTIESLTCLSEESGLITDRCTYNESGNDPEVFILVFADDADTEYSIVISSAGLSDSGEIPGACIDADGDGFGWNGVATCIPDNDITPPVVPVAGACIDSDGDGFGWNGLATCDPDAPVSSPAEPPATPMACIDSDGDGFGWDGVATCIVTASTVNPEDIDIDALPCIDSDGDGFGWQQPPGRPDLGQSCTVTP